ncbi:MAG TPA: cobalt-precorrin-6A reductase [Methylocystis sp.]|nr:cobalt-precorrin-6A reductase [Methylocystis sp.]
MNKYPRPGQNTASATVGRRRALILGGTREARDLAWQVARTPGVEATLSLAGRTSAPLETGLPMRVGGFGGAEGLSRYLAENQFDCVLDATHPFAEQISANARAACALLGLPLATLVRAPWRPQDGDRWNVVADNDAAAAALGEAALGEAPRRVFLTIGRLGVPAFRRAPQHDYLIRSIERPDPAELPPRAEVILARGPFDCAEEIALMRERGIEIVVSKNSGGPLTYAKIEAARALQIPVVMVAQPAREGVEVVDSLEAAMDFLVGGAA